MEELDEIPVPEIGNICGIEVMDEEDEIPVPEIGNIYGIEVMDEAPSEAAAEPMSTAIGLAVTTAIPSRSARKRGRSVDLTNVDEDLEQIDLGDGVVLSMDSSSFKVEGSLELSDNDRELCQSGLAGTANYTISQAFKGLRAAIILNENATRLEQRCKTLESSVSGLKKKNKAIHASMDGLEKKLVEAEDKLKAAEGLLEKEKMVSRVLRSRAESDMTRAVFTTRLRLMEEFQNGKYMKWRPKAEIERCKSLLGKHSGRRDGAGDASQVGVLPAEQGDKSSSHVPAA